MINKKVKGFTLVELLAVIVILSIILVIAVPKIMSVIEDSKKATLESTAKMIASSAEKQKVQNTILGNSNTISCDSVAKINKGDYASCSIEFDGNTAKVTIQGSGKFEGLNICEGTKINSTTQKEACPLSGVEVISRLCKDDATCAANNLAKDSYGSIRYYGANPNNYIEFNNEVWRIIGVINHYTNEEIDMKRIKIVRNDHLEDYQYTVTGEYVNEDFYEYLNNDYYNSLTSLAKTQISNYDLIGTIEDPNDSWDNHLRSYYNTKSPESLRISTIDIVDYRIASNGTGIYSGGIGTNNWLNKNRKYLTSSKYSDMASYYWGQIYIKDDGDYGYVGSMIGETGQPMDVFPSVYLNPNVKLTGTGENTSEGIYKIS